MRMLCGMILAAVAFGAAVAADFNVHATALELPLVSGRSGNPLKRFSFTDCTFRKVSDAELPGRERHGPAVWERVRQTTFEHVEGFTYTNTRFDSP